MNNFTNEEILAWYNCYVPKSNRDSHQEFADRLNISRQEAKVLCHKISYMIHKSVIMKSYN